MCAIEVSVIYFCPWHQYQKFQLFRWCNFISLLKNADSFVKSPNSIIFEGVRTQQFYSTTTYFFFCLWMSCDLCLFHTSLTMPESVFDTVYIAAPSFNIRLRLIKEIFGAQTFKLWMMCLYADNRRCCWCIHISLLRVIPDNSSHFVHFPHLFLLWNNINGKGVYYCMRVKIHRNSSFSVEPDDLLPFLQEPTTDC